MSPAISPGHILHREAQPTEDAPNLFRSIGGVFALDPTFQPRQTIGALIGRTPVLEFLVHALQCATSPVSQGIATVPLADLIVGIFSRLELGKEVFSELAAPDTTGQLSLATLHGVDIGIRCAQIATIKSHLNGF